MQKNQHNDLLLVGWREWIAFPELGIMRIKAKIDTGARTSALHAYNIKRFRRGDKHYIRFMVHPLQRSKHPEIVCEALVHDLRWVTDSGGHRERRYVILTTLELGDRQWPIELTLTNRDSMRFRILLGRTSMRNHFMINPAASYLTGMRIAK